MCFRRFIFSAKATVFLKIQFHVIAGKIALPFVRRLGIGDDRIDIRDFRKADKRGLIEFGVIHRQIDLLCRTDKGFFDLCVVIARIGNAFAHIKAFAGNDGQIDVILIDDAFGLTAGKGQPVSDELAAGGNDAPIVFLRNFQ